MLTPMIQPAVVLILLVSVSQARVFPRPDIGQCPRGYLMSGRRECEGLEGMTCRGDDDCPTISRCCFNGCEMTCLSVLTLVRTYCVEQGQTYHPGEMFQSECSMCACGNHGQKKCTKMPNCGQPNMILLPDGPIDSDDVIPSTMPPNPWLQLTGR